MIKEHNNNLNYYYENNIINIADVDIEQFVEMKKRQELLAMHKQKYDVWLTKDGYYKTYVPDSSKPNGRRQISRKDRNKLDDKIVEAMKLSLAVKIEDLFEEFLDIKAERNEIKPSSCGTYRQVFERHYINTGWSKKDITTLKPKDFCEFLEAECGKNNLPARSFGNLKTITYGIIKRAERNDLINYTPYDVKYRLDAKPKKRNYNSEQQTFTYEETSLLINYLSDPKNRDVQNLSLLFMLLSGVRVGEMVALTYDDFLYETAAIVHRTEIKYRIGGKYIYQVSESPKTEAGCRAVVIPEQYSWIFKELKKLRPFATYLCTNEKGERMTTNCLRRRLDRICKKLKFDYSKSTHKLRKTYCTILMDNGCDERFVTSLMGHTNIKTSEQFYYFDRKTIEEKQKVVNRILDFKAS